MVLPVKRARKRVDLFSSLPPGSILDFPAGGGEESSQLVRMGYQAFAADLFLPKPKPRGVFYVQADANRVFPFREESFDYVLSREGIEHLEYQAEFIRECARVLKPSGKLVITTRNVLHLYGRLSYMLSGQRILGRGFINEIQTPRFLGNARAYHGHAFLIDYFRLRYLLRLSGFDRIEVFTDRYSSSSIALAWMVPLMRAIFALSVRGSIRKDLRKGKHHAYGSVFKELKAHVFSPALLFGKRMIVMATKMPSQIPADVG